MSDGMHAVYANNDALTVRVQELQTERDTLRWQVAQADSYGGYMRHCIRPVSFAEWCERRRAMADALRMERGEVGI